MTIRTHFDGVHTSGMRTHGRPAHLYGHSAAAPRPSPPGCWPHQPRSWRLYRPTAAPRRAGQTHPCGQHRNAHGHAIRAADQMHAPSNERLPFDGALTAACAPAHLPPAPGAHATADWQGEAIDAEPVARGDHLPQPLQNPSHPIGALREATMDAHNADPPRPRAAPVHDRHRPCMMTANIRGGDDRNRQNRGVGHLRSPITALPQVFHQQVDHDKRRYHPIGVHRLLLAMMVVGHPRSCQRCRWSSTSNQGIIYCPGAKCRKSMATLCSCRRCIVLTFFRIWSMWLSRGMSHSDS